MDNAEPLLSRLTELEIKFSFAEDQLDALNQQVYLQHQQIDLLQRELRAFRQHLATNTPDAPLSLRDELPPHY